VETKKWVLFYKLNKLFSSHIRPCKSVIVEDSCPQALISQSDKVVNYQKNVYTLFAAIKWLGVFLYESEMSIGQIETRCNKVPVNRD